MAHGIAAHRMIHQTTEDRFAYYWLQAERARFEARHAQFEKDRLSCLEVAKAWDCLAKSLNCPLAEMVD